MDEETTDLHELVDTAPFTDIQEQEPIIDYKDQPLELEEESTEITQSLTSKMLTNSEMKNTTNDVNAGLSYETSSLNNLPDNINDPDAISRISFSSLHFPKEYIIASISEPAQFTSDLIYESDGEASSAEGLAYTIDDEHDELISIPDEEFNYILSDLGDNLADIEVCPH